MNGKPEYILKIEAIDISSPAAVVEAVKALVNDENLVDEQKLYGFGYLVNKNKEDYILSLKTKLNNQKKEITRLRKQEITVPKKKVVVVRRKPV